MSCLVIAEAGVNHNGSLDLALKLVEIAAKAGADAVKFQTFSAERLVRPGARTAQYQAKATGESDQFAMLKQLELSEADYRRIAARCVDCGIEFMSTPFDEEAATFLLELGMQRIKVPSGEITNIPFLEFLADTDRRLIVSTGMATLEEIDAAVGAIARRRALRGFSAPLAERVTILHCTSNYPAADEDVNLRAMGTIAAATKLPVGYSDHTRGIAVATAAVALGACVIEKHFTVDKSLPGPDHTASVSPEELGALVAQIRTVEAALGSAEKRPTASELPIRALVRRSVTTRRALRAGEAIAAEDVCLLRPGDGIPPAELGQVIGARARNDIAAGITLRWDDLDRA
jgi:N,N'-diacetyllegionaminate synthase